MGVDMGRPTSVIALFFSSSSSSSSIGIVIFSSITGTMAHVCIVRGYIASHLFCSPFADTAAPLKTLLYTHIHTQTCSMLTLLSPRSRKTSITVYLKNTLDLVEIGAINMGCI